MKYVNHPLIYKNTIELRDYQKTISENSRGKNTIVILPTALGKTIISILVCADFLYNYKNSQILIMAPTKPLVLQHLISFSKLLKIYDEQIVLLNGKISPDSRKVIWENKDIKLFFATPEIVKNDLLRQRLDLKKFGLLVFDEAHRAIKDYAYTEIAKSYMSRSSCPFILAMTASPGAYANRIEEICKNLFIEHVEYRNENNVDVKKYINPIQIEQKFFDLPTTYQYISKVLKIMLNEKLLWLVNRKCIQKKNIDFVFKKDLIKLGEDIKSQLTNISITENDKKRLFSIIFHQSAALSLLYCIELVESQGIYSLRSFLNRIKRDESKSHMMILNDRRMTEVLEIIERMKNDEHPKIKYIIDLITSNQKKSFDGITKRRKIIIFTHYRDTATNIVEILKNNNISAVRFVGQANRLDDVGMNQDKQEKILTSFRDGDFDILVATSIAEEGLDIPDVDQVIFYEPISSEIRYIQRKGRTGRKSSGHVVILAVNNTIDTKLLFASKRRIERMNQSLKAIDSTLESIPREAKSREPMMDNELFYLDKLETRKNKKLLLNMSSDYENSSNKLHTSFIKTTSSKTVSYEEIIDQKIRNKYRKFDETSRNNKRIIDRATRHIYNKLLQSPTNQLNSDEIQEDLRLSDYVFHESIRNLNKLRLIKMDKTTITALDKNKKSNGSVHFIYIEKIMSGKALVQIDAKWYAILNYYDFDGPKTLLKNQSEFKAICELYKNNNKLYVRIKELVF